MRALRVVVYTRLSRDPDGTSTAVARQEAECRALAEREGWLVTHVLSDSDFSAWDPRVHRPGFQALLDLVAGAQVDAVLTWKLDRLSRQPGQFEALIAICQQAGARILSATEPADITTPLGLAMLRVGMAMAAAESDSTRLRVRAQKAEAARDGLPNGGGLRPFGLEPSRRVVVPAEAALVREGVRRVLDGETLTAICRSWNRRGISTTRGNEWTVTTLRRMLTAPHIAGLRRHRDAVIESEVIPAIVDRATWERVRAMLTDPARLTVHERTFRALSGLVRCSRCGTVMRARYRHDGRAPLYRCLAQPGTSGCGRMSIAAEPLEALVAQMVAAALDGEGLRERLARGGADTAGARQELADLAVRDSAAFGALVTAAREALEAA